MDFAISSTPPVSAPLPTPPVEKTGATGFGDVLGRALAGVNTAQVEADAAASALASGQSVDTAKTLVTVEKANISFQFAMQIRNKLLEAYQEIMRIQV